MKMTTRPHREAGFATIGRGLVVPRRFTAHLRPDTSDDAPPFAVTLDAELAGGRYQCTRLELEQVEGGPPVDGEGIRTVAVRHLIRAAASHNIYGEKQAAGTDDGQPLVPLSWSLPDVSDGPTDENLRVVAVAYSLAYVCGLPPLRHVEEALGLARSTAGRWVKLARDRGHLGATEPGRAGGAVVEV
jgi:hypothetical protein